MDFEKFLEEYKNIDVESITREQQEEFRKIFFEAGDLLEVEKISKIIYEKNKDDEEAVLSYADSLMYLDKKDDALVVLYTAKRTTNTLVLESQIYHYDGMIDVSSNKIKEALKLAKTKEEKYQLNSMLLDLLVELNEQDEVITLVYELFNEHKNTETFSKLLTVLLNFGKFDTVITLYERFGRKYESVDIEYVVAFSYNQQKDLEKTKEHLIKTIDLAKNEGREFVECYKHLGFITDGTQAIDYLEKYIDMQGMDSDAYLRLVVLYGKNKDYEKLRTLAKELLENYGIDFNTLFIYVTILKELYEIEKIYDIYNEYDIVKQDINLQIYILLSLLEEDEYIDFVLSEVSKNHKEFATQKSYLELLDKIYEVTQKKEIKQLIEDVRKLHTDDLEDDVY